MIRSDPRLDMPMTISHSQLIWRHFATTPERSTAILAGTGISREAIEGGPASITIGQQLQLFANMEALCAPGWIFDVEELLHFSAFSPVSVAVQAAATLADAIDVLVRFTQFRTPMVRVGLRRGRSRAVVEFACIADIETPLWHIVASVSISALRSFLIGVFNLPPKSLRFGLTGDETPQSRALSARLEAPVATGQPVSFLSVPNDMLALPSPYADPDLYAAGIARLEEIVRALTGLDRVSTSMHSRVELLLAQAPPGRLDAEDCALMLGVSRRTMTRKLADEGSGFRQLLEAELQRRATRLLAQRPHDFGDVAEALGYQDPASLRRALARWKRAAT